MYTDNGADLSMTSAIPGFFQGTEMPNSGWWEALWPDPAAVLSATGIKPGMEVIDLCCGDGWFTLPIARVARHVVAIDIDADLLEAARHRLAESDATNCDFVAGDAYELARLVPRPADFIFMANARPFAAAVSRCNTSDKASTGSPATSTSSFTRSLSQ